MGEKLESIVLIIPLRVTMALREHCLASNETIHQTATRILEEGLKPCPEKS